MWHVIVEAFLTVLTFLPIFDRSGPAAIDVSSDTARRRLLVLNAGPGSARAVRVVAWGTGDDGDEVDLALENDGRIRVLRPEKWKWLNLVGAPTGGEWTVQVSWTENGREQTAQFAVAS